MSAGYAVSMLVAGGFAWTFAEYALHHWVGHLGRGRNDFSREHLRHHAERFYFTPTLKKLATAVPVLTAFGAALSLAFGAAFGVPFTLGFGLMYTAYEVLHRRIHTHPPRGFYSRWARRHHFYHHFSGPRMNHGVTTPLWDVVFRTYAAPRTIGVIRVPRKHAMSWLVDAATGEVFPAYAADYELGGRPLPTYEGDEAPRVQGAADAARTVLG